MAIKARRFGANSHELIGTLTNLAVATEYLGDAHAAATVRAHARSIARANLAPNHPPETARRTRVGSL